MNIYLVQNEEFVYVLFLHCSWVYTEREATKQCVALEKYGYTSMIILLHAIQTI